MLLGPLIRDKKAEGNVSEEIYVNRKHQRAQKIHMVTNRGRKEVARVVRGERFFDVEVFIGGRGLHGVLPKPRGG